MSRGKSLHVFEIAEKRWSKCRDRGTASIIDVIVTSTGCGAVVARRVHGGVQSAPKRTRSRIGRVPFDEALGRGEVRRAGTRERRPGRPASRHGHADVGPVGDAREERPLREFLIGRDAHQTRPVQCPGRGQTSTRNKRELQQDAGARDRGAEEQNRASVGRDAERHFRESHADEQHVQGTTGREPARFDPRSERHGLHTQEFPCRFHRSLDDIYALPSPDSVLNPVSTANLLR
jgi:hypothetical protein